MKEFVSKVAEVLSVLFNKNRFFSYLAIVGTITLIILNFYFNILGYVFTLLTVYFLFLFSKSVSNQEEEDILLLEKNKKKKEWLNKKKELEAELFLDPQNKEIKDELDLVRHQLEKL